MRPLVLSACALFHRTALLAPIDPDYRATMIGVGAFVGVLLAAVEHDGWRLGIGRIRGGIPTGSFAAPSMVVMVLICAIDGDDVAAQLMEWRAFHGLHPRSEQRVHRRDR